ncbi:MAG: OB-fold nucleic acid binding domain-containing protein [Candidatus Woesearchaeota archaeon]|nr:MAG: OB-fold nucleic acid binding domain-containing protein [Candidatus Woesearchaeota archaeon]
MKDSILFKGAFIWSIIGICILLLIAEYSEPAKINIISSDENLGKVVTIDGEILSFSSKPTVTFIEVRDKTGEILVVSFSRLKRPPCSAIQVTGKVEVYKGELEIIADEIKCH